ncbi:MAG TPA: ABC transporter permease [Pusillimonas sp.]|uniref:ABC transporter permease n=1 Tax=unclassified Pusillimonas TaxID=2640016 RepID=UPI00260783DA|nr:MULTISPECIES: ABC transporter permease [unclassified Pusillimonas]HLU19190.1 ABC transporter permease [Pusillimonas sp.]
MSSNTLGQAPGMPTSTSWTKLLSGQIPALVLLALCLFSAFMSDRFISSANITNILLQASVLAVVTIGMTYVIIGGGFDLSVGSVVALAGCIAAEVMLHSGIVAGVVAGALSGVAVGVINGYVIARVGVSPFIATLGSMVLVRGVVLLMTQGSPIVGEEGLPDAFVSFGTGRLYGVPYLVIAAITSFIIFAWTLHRTAFGTRTYAVGGNKEAAFLSGVPVNRVVITTYAICGFTAAIAGVMLAARLQSGQPTAGEFYELSAIAAVVLGGAALQGGEGKLYKSMIGVLIMTILANSLNLMGVDSYWQRIAVGLVIILAAAADQMRHKHK